MSNNGNLNMNTKNKINKPKSSYWTEIKQVLAQCSQNDLLGLIADLYALSKQNKDFLNARFIRDNKAIEQYKNKVQRYLAPDEPWKSSQKVSLKEAKKAISDYKKAANDQIGLIDLMVYYVECGTDFLCEYGDMYEQYYISLESVFENVLKLMQQHPVREMEDFIVRLAEVVKKADHTGWGYYDTISSLLNDAYADKE